MLVLSRKEGEKLVIGGNITIEVVRIHGIRITLGVQAPADVKILRSELGQPKPKPQTIDMVVKGGVLIAG